MDGAKLKLERWDKTHERWSELMALQGIDNLDLKSKAEAWHQGAVPTAVRDTPGGDKPGRRPLMTL